MKDPLDDFDAHWDTQQELTSSAFWGLIVVYAVVSFLLLLAAVWWLG